MFRRSIGEVLAREKNPSAVGQIEAGDHAQERRLAAARWPQQGEEFACLDGDADLIDRGKVAETAGDILDLEQRHGGADFPLKIAGL